ncbi:Mitochondrial inner membrane protease atp23, partial [Modicella reniformis]
MAQDSSQAAAAAAIPTSTTPVLGPVGGGGGPSETENKDQKAFERWRKTLSLITGFGLTPEEFQAEIDKADKKTCELRKEKLIKSSPGVRFMMSNLLEAGCPLTKTMLECASCDMTKSGGFSKDHGILLCSNGFFSKKHQEHTMIHEMIH